MKRLLSFILFLSLSFSQDAIEVSPSTLDFGNVLMGNTPTQTFTLTCNLDQTITITPPSFYSVDITEIAMVSGQTQDVIVTFDPPQIGNYDSQIVLAGATFGNAIINLEAESVNSLQGQISGVILNQYSPYEIDGDLYLNEGDELLIEPGVELIFNPGTAFYVNGTLNAIGKPDSLIKMRALDVSFGWGGLIFENSDNSVISYLDVRNALGQSYQAPEILYEEDFEATHAWSGGTLTTEFSNDGGNNYKGESLDGNDNYIYIPHFDFPEQGHYILEFDVISRTEYDCRIYMQRADNSSFNWYEAQYIEQRENGYSGWENPNNNWRKFSTVQWVSGSELNSINFRFYLDTYSSSEEYDEAVMHIDNFRVIPRNATGFANSAFSGFESETEIWVGGQVSYNSSSGQKSMRIYSRDFGREVFSQKYVVKNLPLTLNMDIKKEIENSCYNYFSIWVGSEYSSDFLTISDGNQDWYNSNIELSNYVSIGDTIFFRINNTINSWSSENYDENDLYIDNFFLQGAELTAGLSAINSNFSLTNSSFQSGITGISLQSSDVSILNIVSNYNLSTGLIVDASNIYINNSIGY